MRTALFNLLETKRGQLEDPEDAVFVLRLEDTDYAGVPREQFMNSRINPPDSDFLLSSIDVSELDLAWMIELD